MSGPDMYRIADEQAAWIKLDLLAHGVSISPSLNTLATSARFAARKNFYNTPVWESSGLILPQELRVLGLVVGLNVYRHSPWHLAWRETDEELALEHATALRIRAELIDDLGLFNLDREASRVANLYGGAALAFFSPRSCYFFTDGTQCSFCSLAGTANEEPHFRSILTAEEVRSTVEAAIESDIDRIEQV